MFNGKIGVGIISFNRNFYLKQLIASLEKNTCLENLDFHLFQDGSVNRFSKRRVADPVNINRSIVIFRQSSLPNKHEHIRKDNVGCGIQHFECYEFMFRKYEYAIILENDIVLSPYYFRLVRILIDQLKDYKNIFSFSLGFSKVRRIIKSEKDIIPNLDKIIISKHHWWGEIVFSEKWKKIRPHFLEYYRFIGNIDYSKRNHNAIRAFFKSKKVDLKATSQDSGLDMSLDLTELKRVRTVINRGISIGEKGIHFNPCQFKKMGFHEQQPFIFEEDAKIEQFEWCK
jgi:hypothetical protein